MTHAVPVAYPTVPPVSGGSPLQRAVSRVSASVSMPRHDSTEINTFVSDKIKEKIWNSEYVDLTFLQNVHVQNYFASSVQLTLTNNQLMLKSQSQIYIQRHPCRASEQFLGGLLNRTPLAIVTSTISSSVSVWLMTLQGHGQILTSFMDNFLFGTASGPSILKSKTYAHTCMVCKVVHQVVNSPFHINRFQYPATATHSFRSYLGKGKIQIKCDFLRRLLDQYPQKQDAEYLKNGFENAFPLGCLGPRAHFECNNF
ncbi:LOW QUALITY PROTEIN: hypothetical protein MAR_032440 [Mya arenaria]|uniref:Uncharacterized protein n=1 Tax=Mya arenaria TaxID=6604 RepID=A0ABY7FF14_MYAAR|nr:LOW QUALITY PROTEIN: hypothetical protein MAR_032440 [Mya arenaria]